MPDPFPSFCFTPPQTTPDSLLLTGIRRPLCAPPPAGMLVGHLAESSPVIPKTQSILPFGATVEYHPITAKDKARLHQFGKRVCPGIFYGICAYCGRKLEERHAGSRRKRITRTSRPRSLRATGQCERSFRREIRRQVLFSMCKWIDKVGRKRFRSSHIQSNSASIGKRVIFGVFWKHYTWTLSVDIMFTNCKNTGSWRTHRVDFAVQVSVGYNVVLSTALGEQASSQANCWKPDSVHSCYTHSRIDMMMRGLSVAIHDDHTVGHGESHQLDCWVTVLDNAIETQRVGRSRCGQTWTRAETHRDLDSREVHLGGGSDAFASSRCLDWTPRKERASWKRKTPVTLIDVFTKKGLMTRPETIRAMTRFTHFTILNHSRPPGLMWSGTDWRIYKVQAWIHMARSMVKHVQEVILSNTMRPETNSNDFWVFSN